jgi:hypothetical protein
MSESGMETRNLELSNRLENTREYSDVEVFDIDAIQAHFDESISLIQQQFITVDKLSQNKDIAADEIMRSQIVFLDSAFDYYLHEIVKLGIISMYDKQWTNPVTEKYNNLEFHMKDIEKALEPDNDECWLKEWIDTTYASETMMSFSQFKDICHLLAIDIKKISDVFYEQGSSVKPQCKLKKIIDQLFKRRNYIVHQADRSSKNAARFPITKEEVNGYLMDIIKIVHAVTDEIRLKE